MTKRIAKEDACHREVEAMRIVGFRSAYVFDVSPTDGAPLPSLGTVSGNPGIHLARLVEFASSEGISVRQSSDIAPARGVSLGGKICCCPIWRRLRRSPLSRTKQDTYVAMKFMWRLKQVNALFAGFSFLLAT
jgi:hypothetical protein